MRNCLVSIFLFNLVSVSPFTSNNLKFPSFPRSKYEIAPCNRVSISSSQRSTSMSSSANPIALLAVSSLKRIVNPIVYGGLLSGSLHAVTGPDHLAALLPPSVGQRWWYGMRIGAIWGFGHGISATLIGLCAFLLKGRVSTKLKFLERMSSLAESVVGLSLVAIGLVGMKEVYDSRPEAQSDSNSEEQATTPKTNMAIFLNGILHGFSWDGAPSLAPALAMTSLRSALSFFLSYCVGTITVMSLVAGGVGECTVRLGKAFNSPELPRKLSFVSSLVAIAIGLFWIVQAFM
eukprot:gene10725-22403_t